ncbi:MAG: THUMP domain-containing protein [Candidatus Nitrosotenuis sp.]
MKIIVTCARHFEDETKQEISSILEELGDSEPKIEITKFSGILLVDTSVDPGQLTNVIRHKLEDEPWSIRYILRVIPLFKTIRSCVAEISEAALEQVQKMMPHDTYRITIEKRDSNISTSEIITQIADKIKNKVSLKEYDWIVLVEIFGDMTGVSVLKDSDVLSVEKARRKSFD